MIAVDFWRYHRKYVESDFGVVEEFDCECADRGHSNSELVVINIADSTSPYARYECLDCGGVYSRPIDVGPDNRGWEENPPMLRSFLDGEIG